MICWRRWRSRAGTFAGSVGMLWMGACGATGEMTVVVEGLRGALGEASRPALVTLVVYAPRGDAGRTPPDVTEPGWEPTREDRRIAPWNGEDTMSLRVVWSDPSAVTALRVQAVVATGSCGDVRTVLAEGEVTGVSANGGASARASIRVRPVAAAITSSGRCP
jgi:hypothetical protein